MANETIRRLCDGEELVLAEESIPPALNPPRDRDPRSGTLERRHRALAGRSDARWADAGHTHTAPGLSRARPDGARAMLFEISVIPLGGDIHLSDELGEVLSVIDRSGLPYLLGPGSTCVEGEWDEAMALVHECHRVARRASRHVITLIKVEDDAGQRHKLKSNVRSVEEKAGRPLETQVESTVEGDASEGA